MRASGATPTMPAPSRRGGDRAGDVRAVPVRRPAGSASSSTKSQPGHEPAGEVRVRRRRRRCRRRRPSTPSPRLTAQASGASMSASARPRCHQTDWPVLCSPHWSPASGSAASRRGRLGSAHVDVRVGAQRRERRARSPSALTTSTPASGRSRSGATPALRALGARQAAVAQRRRSRRRGRVARPRARAARRRRRARRGRRGRGGRPWTHRNRPPAGVQRPGRMVQRDAPG